MWKLWEDILVIEEFFMNEEIKFNVLCLKYKL